MRPSQIKNNVVIKNQYKAIMEEFDWPWFSIIQRTLKQDTWSLATFCCWMTDCSSTGNGSEKNSKNIQNTYFGKEKKVKIISTLIPFC